MRILLTLKVSISVKHISKPKRKVYHKVPNCADTKIGDNKVEHTNVKRLTRNTIAVAIF